ncbi:DNA-binding transcriptional regulator, LysR family [Streptomyces sp. AmelKG-E11A]|nr:DNA-binding transcriptional regulator, LysR family [Streptomyces sp. AmelKG-E11A]
MPIPPGLCFTDMSADSGRDPGDHRHRPGGTERAAGRTGHPGLPSLRTLEIRHLRCFLAIAEEGSVTRAAERLRLTQPAVSRTLAALEDALGVRLVDRSTHHLALTAHGRVFRDRASAAVTAFEAALDAGRGSPRPLRVGHPWSAAGPYTTPLLRRWRAAHPSVALELLRIDDRTAGLTRGLVDAAFLRGPVTAPGLETAVLYEEGQVAAVASDSALAGRSGLALADLADRTIALNTVSGVTTLDLWPSAIRPTSTVTVANTDDWLAAIAADRAVGVSATATADIHPHAGVAYVPLTDAPRLPVTLAWPAGVTDPRVRDLLDLAREVVAEH